MDKKLLRFGIHMLRAKLQKTQNNPRVVKQSFCATPNEMGLNDHLPNFRFPIFAELGRLALLNSTPKAKPYRFCAFIANQQFIYIRPIKWFERFTVRTELMYWDEKYSYFLHDFYVKDNKVAVAVVKTAFKKQGKVASPVAVFGESPVGTELSDKHQALIQQWQVTQDQFKTL